MKRFPVHSAVGALLLVVWLSISGCSSNGDVQGTRGTVALNRAFAALSFTQPLGLLQAPGDDSRWFILEKAGKVLVFANDQATTTSSVFLDISSRVDSASSEAGLLGMAFHPDFAANGQVFISYTAAASAPPAVLTSHLSRFISSDGGNTLDPASEEILLSLDQPFTNHNGGNLAFGPDGFLYIGFGDGGSGGDPQGHGQNTDTLLGAMLRIDVDGGTPYGIPPDNPFASGNGRAEIFAWGLRNPWRWSFDRVTGELWAADVGQQLWEEVDRIVLGGNYGWNIREGAQEGCSITGGYVYRGNGIPGLAGTYIYGDFCTGTIWGINSSTQAAAVPRVLIESGLAISSFAEANNGELYVIDLTAGTVHELTEGL